MLGETTRSGDLAFRLGGEEFAVLLMGMGHEGAIERAESWRTALASVRIPIEGAALRLTASFGVATFPAHANSVVELMKVSDARMYQAKAQGRDQVIGQSFPRPA